SVKSLYTHVHSHTSIYTLSLHDALPIFRQKIDVPEDALLCHPAYPLNPDAKDAIVAANQPKRKLYHNCSGKHLGMIALAKVIGRSEEHTSELQSRFDIVCRLLLEKKKTI